MNKELTDYARMVSLMAQQKILRADMAQDFCERVLPDLVQEMEVLDNVADRLSQMLSASMSAWRSMQEEKPAEPEQPVEEPKPAPKAKRSRGRRRKEPSND